MPSLPQRRFVKGLNAATPAFAQPPGTLPRISNLLLTKRGGLITTPGSATLSKLDNMLIQAAPIRVYTVFIYQPSAGPAHYVALISDPTSQTDPVADLAYAGTTGGGTLGAGDFYWVVTALDGVGGETTVSNEVHHLAVNPEGNALLAWTAIYGAASYNVYRGITPGGELLIIQNNVATVANDTGMADLGITPPTGNTTRISRLISVPLPAYTRASTLRVLPAAAVPLTFVEALGQVPAITPRPTPAGVLPPTPYGGVVGGISELPQLLQFNNDVIACLGNGFPLQVYDGGTVVDVSNTFVAVYPNWAAATAFPTLALIQATISSIAYVFKVQQGGTTATGSDPTASWPTGEGQTVVDGSVIWANAGLVTNSAPPPGAAHGIVYAGALWVYNTAPTTNADKTAGPCCLQMSDINNPNSWNPLNVAFIGKDDGTQGTGLASFTIAESGISPTGSLVAFKDFGTFQIIGVFGAPDFQIIQAQTDMGCIAPRSIQFLPGFGIARLTHLGVAVFDGVRDRLISPEIYPYLFGGEADITSMNIRRSYLAHGAQSTTPPMYLLAIPIGADDTNVDVVWPYYNQSGYYPLTRILCYDLVLKAWTIVDLPFAISCLRQVRFANQGGLPLTLCGGWDDGTLRRLFAGDVDWQDIVDPNFDEVDQEVAWSVRTPEVFGKSAADRLSCRALYVKGATKPTTIAAQLTMDSSIRPLLNMKVVTQSGIEFEALIQTHQLGKNIHADISGTGPAELHSFDWDVEPQPSAPAVLV